MKIRAGRWYDANEVLTLFIESVSRDGVVMYKKFVNGKIKGKYGHPMVEFLEKYPYLEENPAGLGSKKELELKVGMKFRTNDGTDETLEIKKVDGNRDVVEFNEFLRGGALLNNTIVSISRFKELVLGEDSRHELVKPTKIKDMDFAELKDEINENLVAYNTKELHSIIYRLVKIMDEATTDDKPGYVSSEKIYELGGDNEPPSLIGQETLDALRETYSTGNIGEVKAPTPKFDYEDLKFQYISYREQFLQHSKPHVAYGWVKEVNPDRDTINIRCDDSYGGARGFTIKLKDVITILKYKEEPK